MRSITAIFLTMCHLHTTLLYWFNTSCHIMSLFFSLILNLICFTKQHFYSGFDCKYLISNDLVLSISKHWSPRFMIHSRHSDPIPQMILQILYGDNHISTIVLNTNFPTSLLRQITTYLYILQSGKHSCFLLHQLLSHQSINFICHHLSGSTYLSLRSILGPCC